MSIGKKVIVRTDRAGVFFGTLLSKTPHSVIMRNVRKLYYWEGANAVEEIATNGVRYPNRCKFTVVVEEMELASPIQIIPATQKAILSVEEVPEWTAK